MQIRTDMHGYGQPAYSPFKGSSLWIKTGSLSLQKDSGKWFADKNNKSIWKNKKNKKVTLKKKNCVIIKKVALYKKVGSLLIKTGWQIKRSVNLNKTDVTFNKFFELTFSPKIRAILGYEKKIHKLTMEANFFFRNLAPL